MLMPGQISQSVAVTPAAGGGGGVGGVWDTPVGHRTSKGCGIFRAD